MGGCCSDLPICLAQWRSSCTCVQLHYRRNWFNSRCSIPRRDGLNANLNVLRYFSNTHWCNRDPTVGAQYRWSARFAQRGAKLWGFMQGMLLVPVQVGFPETDVCVQDGSQSSRGSATLLVVCPFCPTESPV